MCYGGEGQVRLRPLDMPPKTSELGPKELHVWTLEDASKPGRCWQLLSPDERKRAVRFHKQCDADQFVIRRAALRQILGGYLHVPPETVKLAYNAHGKPFLNDADALGTLEFNVSHSGSVALIAVTRDHPIGIDIELISNHFPVAEMAPEVFSPSELDRFFKLPANAKHIEFFRTWVAKEAFLKALGKGLSIEPNTLEVDALPVDFIKTVDGFASAISMPTCLPTKIRHFPFGGHAETRTVPSITPQ
jgi:4'-phosphopantetheinyl transferase